MAETIEKSLLDLDFAALTRRDFTPSPAAWEDQVLYFLLLDRFSDGREQGGYRDDDGRPVPGGVTPLYRPEDPGRVDYDTWFQAGGRCQGGMLRGLRSRLSYLRRITPGGRLWPGQRSCGPPGCRSSGSPPGSGSCRPPALRGPRQPPALEQPVI